MNIVIWNIRGQLDIVSIALLQHAVLCMLSVCQSMYSGNSCSASCVLQITVLASISCICGLYIGHVSPPYPAATVLLMCAMQAVDCYRKALQAADNNNSEYAARVKALNKAIGKKVQIEKAQVSSSPPAEARQCLETYETQNYKHGPPEQAALLVGQEVQFGKAHLSSSLLDGAADAVSEQLSMLLLGSVL
jgi:hypothetical protein